MQYIEREFPLRKTGQTEAVKVRKKKMITKFPKTEAFLKQYKTPADYMTEARSQEEEAMQAAEAGVAGNLNFPAAGWECAPDAHWAVAVSGPNQVNGVTTDGYGVSLVAVSGKEVTLARYIRRHAGPSLAAYAQAKTAASTLGLPLVEA